MDDLSDDTADRGNLVADADALAHLIEFFLTLFLRPDHKEVDQDEYDGNVANHKQRISAARGAGIGTCRAAGSAAGEAEAEDRNDSDQ